MHHFRNSKVHWTVRKETLRNTTLHISDNSSTAIPVNASSKLPDGTDGRDYEYVYMNSDTNPTPPHPTSERNPDWEKELQHCINQNSSKGNV